MTRDFVPPQLSDLFARYLQQQASAHEEGLGFADATGEVIPHEAAPVQPVEPRLAWEEALTAIRCLVPKMETRSLAVPPEWPLLVASQEPETALAFCGGNFPQLVRNLVPLLQATNPAELRKAPGRPLVIPALLEWAKSQGEKPQFPQALLVIGALRLAREFDQAREMLNAVEKKVPAEWKNALANERAALAWHSGQAEEAAEMWRTQPESAPVLFNRGMAALFLGRPAEARAPLGECVQQLPESSAWHHLARLYLALAEMRG